LKPAAFAYCAPETEDDVMSLLAEYGSDAKLLAGGQSLLPLLNMRLVRPEVLIDLGRVSALRYIRTTQAGLCIGPLTTQRACECSSEVARHAPLLADALRFVGHPQIRNRGTVGGSLCHADPAAELPAVMAALGGTLVVKGLHGERVLTPEQFFVSYLTTALEPTELLREVRIPTQTPHTGSAFLEVSRRRGDFAIVAAAATIILGEGRRVAQARIVLVGVGPTPIRATEGEALLAGRMPTDQILADLAQIVSAHLSPESDIQASADYRRHAAGVLAARAVREAVRRAQARRQ
jgi:CO/xanthine dehydrogenase FAD-binding subunit